MRHIHRFAICTFLLLPGCPTAPTLSAEPDVRVSPDAGIVSDAGAPADGGDGAPDLSDRWAPCTPGNGDCSEGLVCMTSPFNPNVGICDIGCGALNAEGTAVVEDSPSPCPDGEVCQGMLNADTGELLGVVCQLQSGLRDGPCVPSVDNNSCSPTIDENVSCDRAEFGFECRVGCGAGGACPEGESCLQTGQLQPEVSRSGTVVECVVDAECSDAASCQRAAFADGSVRHICAFDVERCGVGVVSATHDDVSAVIAGATVSDNHACDVFGGHRYCQDASAACIDVTGAGDRLCLAVCGQDDANGSYAEDACPGSQACTFAIALAVGLGDVVENDIGAPQGCPPDNCPVGMPCPDECAGDERAHCVDTADGGRCIRPIGICDTP